MTEIDERYKRGKIYTIRCRDDNSSIYVGSTIDKLAKRMARHRKDKKCSLYQIVDDDWDNWYIELYEDYPCDNKEQLRKREGEVIREIATINSNIAGRSRKDYYEEFRDERLEKDKQRYQNNRDKILEHNKQYYQENRDMLIEYQKQYRQNNRDNILEKKKQYYENNRDELLEKRKEKCKCDICGAEITKLYLKNHQKTTKCMSANK
jgi:hypothetical protein